MMKDKNGKEMRTGDIVKVSGAYTKRHNGYFVIEHTPGDVSWLGEDYSLQRLKKNGEYSNGSYTTQFWPLSYFSNNKTHNELAYEHDSKNATIEIVGNINTEFIIANFEKESENSLKAAKDYAWRFGEDSEVTRKALARSEHYKKVVEYIKGKEEKEEEITEKSIQKTAKGIKEEKTTEIQKIVAEVKEEIEPKAEETERIYYTINEKAARIAKEINSFSEYKARSATNEYHHYCNKAYDILDKIRIEKPEQAEKVEKKVGYYCRKLAKYYNDYYRNEASCPSVMICGAGNFPVKKKNRQNNHRETLHNTWKYLENYIRKIEDILTNEQPIKSGDTDAIEKLTEKIKNLEEEHKMHMECNRYYKKNGTLEDFEGLEEKEAAKIEDFIKINPFFPPFITTNETANIRRYKQRLEKLIKEKDTGIKEKSETNEENNELFTVVENKEIMRLQILFDGIPPTPTRDILKSNGFRWSPKNKAWQRQLTDNARYTYKNIKESLIYTLSV